jgi:hypothetical protein
LDYRVIKPIDSILRMHLLRHFKTVPQGYIEKHFPEVEFEIAYQALKSTRSKFKAEFAGEPDSLFDTVLTFRNRLTFNNDCPNKRELSIVISKNVCPDGIGYDNLAVISSINETTIYEKVQIEHGPENYKVTYVELSQLPLTWTMNVIFMQEDQDVRIITVFPGTFAPPFPDVNIHTKQQYKLYDQFWNEHAFIKLKP